MKLGEIKHLIKVSAEPLLGNYGWKIKTHPHDRYIDIYDEDERLILTLRATSDKVPLEIISTYFPNNEKVYSRIDHFLKNLGRNFFIKYYFRNEKNYNAWFEKHISQLPEDTRIEM